MSVPLYVPGRTENTSHRFSIPQPFRISNLSSRLWFLHVAITYSVFLLQDFQSSHSASRMQKDWRSLKSRTAGFPSHCPTALRGLLWGPCPQKRPWVLCAPISLRAEVVSLYSAEALSSCSKSVFSPHTDNTTALGIVKLILEFFLFSLTYFYLKHLFIH